MIVSLLIFIYWIDIIKGDKYSQRQIEFLKFSKKENLHLDLTFISTGFTHDQIMSATLTLQYILDRFLNEEERNIDPIHSKVIIYTN